MHTYLDEKRAQTHGRKFEAQKNIFFLLRQNIFQPFICNYVNRMLGASLFKLCVKLNVDGQKFFANRLPSMHFYEIQILKVHVSVFQVRTMNKCSPYILNFQFWIVYKYQDQKFSIIFFEDLWFILRVMCKNIPYEIILIFQFDVKISKTITICVSWP